MRLIIFVTALLLSAISYGQTSLQKIGLNAGKYNVGFKHYTVNDSTRNYRIHNAIDRLKQLKESMNQSTNSNLIQILYHEVVSIDRNVLLDADSDEETELTDEEIEEVKELNKTLHQLIDQQEKRANTQIHKYTIGPDNIRYERPHEKPMLLFTDEFILIEPNERIMNHYFISKKKGPGLQKFPLDRSAFRPLEVNYEINSVPSDRKNILGYDCYKMIITETISDREFGVECLRYDLYVTEAIDFPFHLMNSILKPMINKCALEITTRIKGKGTSCSIMTAAEIQENIDVDHVVLPDKFIIK